MTDTTRGNTTKRLRLVTADGVRVDDVPVLDVKTGTVKVVRIELVDNSSPLLSDWCW